MKTFAFRVVFISCLFAGISTIFADTQVGGLLLDDDTWIQSNSPYIVTTSIIIGNGATLTIEANVVVKIDPKLSIIVGSESDGEGVLIAEGQPGKPVTFTSNTASPGPGDWSHIHFAEYAKGAVISTLYDEYGQPQAPEYDSGCKLEHVIVEYGGYEDFAVVFVEGTAVYLNNCEIRNNSAFGLEVHDSTGARDLINHTDFPLVEDCNVWNNTGGLFLADIDNYAVTNNHIYQNQGAGIILEAASWSLIQGNTINNNWYPLSGREYDDIFGGLVIQSASHNDIVGNTICHNASLQHGGGIGVYSGIENDFWGNIICNNSAESRGGGIYNSTYNSSTFTNNIICGNIARNNGGGVFSNGGLFAGNYIEENTANNGGGFSSNLGTTFDENVIRYNNAYNEGGGAYVSGQVTLTNNWITYNHKQQGQTGGIFVAYYASLLQIAGDLNENSYNSIWGNEGYQLYNDCPLAGDNNLQAQYVCWGTDNYEEIQAGIFDFYVDSTHAFVYWEPAIGCLGENPEPNIAIPSLGLNGYGGGYGTTDNPYLIYTAEQLQAIGTYHFDWDRNFKLMADVDLAELGETSFNTIGGPSVTNPVQPGKGFSGVFDGNGYVIANFHHVSTGLSDIGLFGFVSGGEIKNLGLISPDIDTGGGRNVGALVGYAIANTTIENCYVEGGTVSNGVWSIGGLVGIIDGTITNCHTSCTVTGDTSVGGLVGGMHGTEAIISNCYTTGDVQGTNTYVGGLVGHSGYSGIEITDCYTTGNVEGFEHVGGLVGADSGSYIHDCYATGTVQGEQWVGGFLGSGDNLETCYATGDVYGYGYAGGLVGSGGSIYDCFATGDIYVLSGASMSPGNFGGLAGTADDDISGCFATGNVNENKITTASDVGGLVGENSATIYDCYARGSVFGDRQIGGLIGNNHNAIYRCYATGKVSGNDQVAGIAGYEETWGMEVFDCFWDTQSSAMPTSKGGTGKTTAQMYNQNTYLEAGWDFVSEEKNGTEDIWMMINVADYPHLAWELTGGHGTRPSYELTVVVSNGSGHVIPDSDTYLEGTNVTLTAVPDPGYKVKSWQGTDDNASTSTTNTVTMDSDKIVTVEFEEITPDVLEITKLTVKAGKTRDGVSDSFTLTGKISSDYLDLVSDPANNLSDITIAVFPVDDSNIYGRAEELISQNIKVDARRRKITYKATIVKGQLGRITSFKVDMVKGKFAVVGKNLDLTGLSSPVKVELSIGDYFGSGTASVDQINGKKSMPIQFMMGYTDLLQVDKCTFKLGTRKPNTDSLTIQGAIAVANTSVDIAGEDIVVSWGDYEITLPANDLYRIRSKRAFKYKRPKGSDSSIAAAIFDLEKCTFKIIVKNANISSQNNPIDFSMQFADFSKTITLQLTEKKSNYWCFP